jgi:hypothetical protein
LNYPSGIALDMSGRIVIIADQANYLVRYLDAVSEIPMKQSVVGSAWHRDDKQGSQSPSHHLRGGSSSMHRYGRQQ